MSLYSHIPRWPLSEFGEMLWLTADYQPAHEVERVLPTARSGRLSDPFGHVWIIETHLEDLSADELRTRFEGFARR